MPLSALSSGSSASSAPMPPAEAPTPTTGIWPLRRGLGSPSPSLLSFFFMQQRTPETAVSYHVLPIFAIAQQAFDHLGILRVLAGPLLELVRQPLAAAGAFLLGHALGERRALLMGAQKGAEQSVDLLGLRRQDRIGRVGMSDVAAVVQHDAVVDFPERAVAFGAGEARELAEHGVHLHVAGLLSGNRRFQSDAKRDVGRGARLLARQGAEQGGHARHRHDTVYVGVTQRTAWHRRDQGIIG